METIRGKVKKTGKKLSAAKAQVDTKQKQAIEKAISSPVRCYHLTAINERVLQTKKTELSGGNT